VLLVSAATEVTDELLEALRRMLPQLSASAGQPTGAELAEILGSPATALLVAREEENGPIVGMLTLVVFRIPTGMRALIEDVVVDEPARGRGVGEALTNAAIDLAATRGAKTLDLTSRPAREAANRLYQRMGFEQRETNVYRYRLDE